jgi:hypothetical protein
VCWHTVGEVFRLRQILGRALASLRRPESSAFKPSENSLPQDPILSQDVFVATKRPFVHRSRQACLKPKPLHAALLELCPGKILLRISTSDEHLHATGQQYWDAPKSLDRLSCDALRVELATHPLELEVLPCAQGSKHWPLSFA